MKRCELLPTPTLGQIGFVDRWDDTAIGTVCNLAARLCAEPKDGQILPSGRVAVAVEETISREELGSMAVKGITQRPSIFNIVDQQAAGASAEVNPAATARETAAVGRPAGRALAPPSRSCSPPPPVRYNRGQGGGAIAGGLVLKGRATTLAADFPFDRYVRPEAREKS